MMAAGRDEEAFHSRLAAGVSEVREGSDVAWCGCVTCPLHLEGPEANPPAAAGHCEGIKGTNKDGIEVALHCGCHGDGIRAAQPAGEPVARICGKHLQMAAKLCKQPRPNCDEMMDLYASQPAVSEEDIGTINWLVRTAEWAHTERHGNPCDEDNECDGMRVVEKGRALVARLGDREGKG